MSNAWQELKEQAGTETGFFLRLEPDKQEVVRLISDPVSFMKRFRPEDDPRRRFGVLAIHRIKGKDKTLGKVVAWEFGASVLDQIAAFDNDDDHGNPSAYDLKVTKTGSGMDTKYHVLPGKSYPLTEADRELITEFGEMGPDRVLRIFTGEKDDADPFGD